MDESVFIFQGNPQTISPAQSRADFALTGFMIPLLCFLQTSVQSFFYNNIFMEKSMSQIWKGKSVARSESICLTVLEFFVGVGVF